MTATDPDIAHNSSGQDVLSAKGDGSKENQTSNSSTEVNLRLKVDCEDRMTNFRVMHQVRNGDPSAILLIGRGNERQSLVEHKHKTHKNQDEKQTS